MLKNLTLPTCFEAITSSSGTNKYRNNYFTYINILLAVDNVKIS